MHLHCTILLLLCLIIMPLINSCQVMNFEKLTLTQYQASIGINITWWVRCMLEGRDQILDFLLSKANTLSCYFNLLTLNLSATLFFSFHRCIMAVGSHDKMFYLLFYFRCLSKSYSKHLDFGLWNPIRLSCDLRKTRFWSCFPIFLFVLAVTVLKTSTSLEGDITLNFSFSPSPLLTFNCDLMKKWPVNFRNRNIIWRAFKRVFFTSLHVVEAMRSTDNAWTPFTSTPAPTPTPTPVRGCPSRSLNTGTIVF